MRDNEILFSMIEKLGIKHQATVCIEELSELQKELTRLIRDKGSQMHICEEIADVEVCLAQMKLFFDPDKKYVSLFKTYKMRRLKMFYLEGVEK